MQEQTFMTPALVVDGSELAFVGAIEPGREVEAFATLLTFATFSEKTAEVIDEVYTAECARTGVASRLSQDRWYQVAKEYFDEFLENMRSATPDDLLGHFLWLDKHFFAKHRGYESVRSMIGSTLKADAAARKGRILH